MKLLLDENAEAGGGNVPPATPPKAAETVAGGKSERELQLERENAKLKNAVKQTAEKKRKVEINNAHLADENHRLKQVTQPPATQPAPEKRSWMGFTG